DVADVCVTSINRQIHAMSGTIGKSKVEVMAEGVKLINPECKVNLVDDFMTPDNQHLYLNKSFDYVLDT
ncbi:ThiF family adenylyltransferase, partial [Vibrio cholerae]|uniref:ThiF family adenylyltransferase n=1 Tax=Vibrio cholerae TaxID=666 RepID=UPI001C0FA671